jgi:hypothetical protein
MVTGMSVCSSSFDSSSSPFLFRLFEVGVTGGGAAKPESLPLLFCFFELGVTGGGATKPERFFGRVRAKEALSGVDGVELFGVFMFCFMFYALLNTHFAIKTEFSFFCLLASSKLQEEFKWDSSGNL